MKKKMFSLLMALVITFSALPWNAAAVMFPMEETSQNTGSAEGSEESGSTEEPTPSEGEETLLTAKTQFAKHPSHLTDGKISITGNIAFGVGRVAFAKGTVTSTGKVKVSDWAVDDDGILTFTQSSGKDGDTITFTVTVSSEKYPPETLTVVVVLGYDQLIITSETTMTYGSTLTLTCVGARGNGTVVYTVTNVTGAATVSGNVLTATQAGTVTVSATQLKGNETPAGPSESVTITINKATPTASPSFTALSHAGQTLSEAALALKTSSVPGRMEWVLSDDTIVVANTEYEWRFVPDDKVNYNSINGMVTPYVVGDKTFAAGEGTTVQNQDGSYTTTSYGEDDSSYKLTEYPDGRKRMVHTKLDGTVTTTVLEADGTRTETIENPDRSRQIKSTDKTGISHTTIYDRYGYTTVQVYIPSVVAQSAVRNQDALILPIPEIPCTDDRSDAPVVTFSLSAASSVRVKIPVDNPTAGVVAIIVDKNGQETVIKNSIVGRDALYVTLSGSVTLKIADLSKSFLDVDRRHWFKDAADFVTSRGLFNGVSNVLFDPSGHMSRAMLVTVLHNLEGNPYYGYGPSYGYIPGYGYTSGYGPSYGYDPYYGYSGYYNDYLSDVYGTWYETAALWAISNGHITGYEDGTFRGDVNITREQLAVILYRYAGYPSVKNYVNHSITDYLDYKTISPYAADAMYWAVCSGVLYTAGRDKLAPQQAVTRAEVAQTFKNLVEFLAD